MTITFAPLPGRARGHTETWFSVRGHSYDGDAYAVSVDADGHPTVWKGEYPLGTSLEAVTLYRAFAQYLYNRLEG